VTGAYLQRVTLTVSALARAKQVLLLLSGAEKRALIGSILDDPHSQLPMRAVIDTLGDRLTILYAA